LCLLCLLGLTFVSVCFGYCCTPNQWSSAFSNWDPERNFFTVGFQAYDYTNQREFVFFEEDQGFRRVNVSIILLFKNQKGYRLEQTGSTTSCTPFDVPQKMGQFCVAPPARQQYNVTIGGSLKVTVYEIIASNGDRGFVSLADSGCLPVKFVNVLNRPQFNIDQADYWDVVPRVDPKLFTPPSFC